MPEVKATSKITRRDFLKTLLGTFVFLTAGGITGFLFEDKNKAEEGYGSMSYGIK